MSRRENSNKIDQTFQYDVPDDYLSQVRTLGKTGTWTYNGYDKIWVFFKKSDNKYGGRFLTEGEDGATYPTPLDMYKIEIDCATNPLLCTLFGADEVKDYDLLDQYTETLPDGTTYTRVHTPPPDHTYELNDITYNPETGWFDEPLPWKKPHMDWEKLRNWRLSKLEESDNRVVDDMPADIKAQWEEYRQKLRDLPQVHGAAHSGEEPTTEPWKIQPIPDPDGLT